MSILFIVRFYILYKLNISFHNNELRADVYQLLTLLSTDVQFEQNVIKYIVFC